MSKPKLSVKVDLALHVTLHPGDAATVAQTLPRQLDAWAPHVDRVVLTIDSQARLDCRGPALREARKTLFVLLESLRQRHPGLGIDAVVYADHFRAKIAATYFGGQRDWPDHAVDGSPFYAFFFGLMRTNARRILHVSATTVHSGRTAAWLEAAQARLDADHGLLALAPDAVDLPRDGEGEATLLIDTTRLADVVVPLGVASPSLGEKLKAGVLARDLRSRPAVIALAQGSRLAGLSMAPESEVALGREYAGAARGPGTRQGWTARVRRWADRLVGAQLRRLGRI